MMGNPGGHFTDFEEQTQIITWKWMVEKLAKHYIQRYGLNEVSQWNFETWNEPDHHDFDGLTFTVQGYLNYFDATFQGLKDVSKHVKIGGPGGSCREPHFITLCHALLVHSQNGTNIVSGKKGGSKLDFISFHQKGDQNSRNVVQSTVKKISEIQLLVPELTKDLPFFNDEGDPEKGWWKSRSWRADVRYPASVASNILGLQEIFMHTNTTRLAILSNDNAFLNVPPSFFEQRTLLTRFSTNNQSRTELFDAFVQKPVFNLMAMLALLGDQVVQVESSESAHGVQALATKSLMGYVILLVRNDECNATKAIPYLPVRLLVPALTLTNHAGLASKFVIYKLTNVNTNPYHLWQTMGSPERPTEDQLRRLRIEGSLKRGTIRDLRKKRFRVVLPNPGIKLLIVCQYTESSEPEQPTKLRFYAESSGALTITWRYSGGHSDHACLKGFQVYFSHDYLGDYKSLIDEERLSAMNFVQLHGKATNFRGWFQVIAIDLWNRRGPSSVHFYNQIV
eukprot:TCALIF_03681-PA protein Name:"Similar to Idua Alpha-L-iduronidase (Mus musculus)" AED:0.08 eAED:0.08 QI:0/-1/0/1/-1/1/1/0/507